MKPLPANTGTEKFFLATRKSIYHWRLVDLILSLMIPMKRKDISFASPKIASVSEGLILFYQPAGVSFSQLILHGENLSTAIQLELI